MNSILWHDDVLLKEVSGAFARLATLQHDLLTQKKTGMELQAQLIVRHLLLLQWRSRDVLKEFAEFYCVRLLLDHQSPLATYFIDLFSQLDWMLYGFKAIHNSSRQPRHDELYRSMDELRRSMSPAISTCRLLYAAHRMLPRSKTLQGLDEQRVVGTEFKREGMHVRMFSHNEPHCRIRELGLVDLDRQGTSMVCLSKKLGEGGFATVYRGDFEADDENGRTSKIGDPVAVKMFSNGKSGSVNFSSEEDQFSSELHKLVSVRHPNIVTPKGWIGERSQGESGLVMELMDESLHDYLEKVKRGDVPPLQELDMLDLMLEIAKGMRFLHESNLIHGDLKPQNVLLRFCRDCKDQGCKLLEVKLADFGLTKLCDFAQAGGSTMYKLGTPCYTAPELRARGPAPSQESPSQIEKVDVFSYGTTCFKILISNPDTPKFSQSDKVFYEAVKTKEWKQWVQGVDEHLHYLVKLIARCWESEPARRPTFAALCALLQHAMQCCLVPDRLTTRLYRKVPSGKLHYSNVYKSIIEECLRLHGAVRGVKAIKQCFLDFESIYSAKPPPTHSNRFLQMAILTSDFALHMKAMRNVLKTSDFARDVFLSREAMRKGHFKVWLERAKGYFEVIRVERAKDNLEARRNQVIRMIEAAKDNLEAMRNEGFAKDDLEAMRNHVIRLEREKDDLEARRKEVMRLEREKDDLEDVLDVSVSLMRKGHFKVWLDRAKGHFERAKGHFKVWLEHAKRPALYLCEFMDDCLDNQDPVRLLKGLACCNFAIMYATKYAFSTTGESLVSMYGAYGFDFKKDDAFSELEVDESLIPFLVTFWLL